MTQDTGLVHDRTDRSRTDGVAFTRVQPPAWHAPRGSLQFCVIHSFRHKGLQRLFDDDDARGVNPEHVGKLKNILASLDAAPAIEHINMPNFRSIP